MVGAWLWGAISRLSGVSGLSICLSRVALASRHFIFKVKPQLAHVARSPVILAQPHPFLDLDTLGHACTLVFM